MKRLLLASLLVACSSLFAGSAFAQAKPEDAIKYRQGVYRVIGWNFGPMAAMVKGDPRARGALPAHQILTTK